MKITLDGEELSLGADVIADGKAAILKAARDAALAKGRVVCGIEVDGQALESDEAFLSLSGGLEARFASQTVRDLATDTMAEGTAYLPKLVTGLEGIATRLEAGNAAEARSMIVQAVEGINWLFGVFDRACGLLGITVDSLKSGSFNEDAAEINGVLAEMKESLEDGKELKLAFLIRDKFLPSLRRFASYWEEVSRAAGAPLQ